MAVVLGVDSSTQSTKVEVRALGTGELVASGSAKHPPTTPPISEQDPGSWWSAVVEAVEQLGNHRRDVVAISVAAQQHGLVLVDIEGEPVRSAPLWNDTSAANEAAELIQKTSRQQWASACGSVPTASFTISKLAWMHRHDPEALERTDKVMLPHDYLTWRLSGRHVTDRGDASGTGWFNSSTNMYRTDLLDLAVPDAPAWLSRLPEVVPGGSVVGTLLPIAADSLGLDRSVIVASGTGDNMAGALGLGLKRGDIALSLGTSGAVYSVSATGTADASGMVAGFADATDSYLPLVCTLNATKVTDTIAEWVGTNAAGLSDLAVQASSGFAGELVVPFFDGERSPNLPHATGKIVGVTTSTSKETLARAAHDGVLCNVLNGLDSLTELGVETGGRLHLIGGGSRSQAYQQRCADLFGAPIVVPRNGQLVSTGAALQAASAFTGRAVGDIANEWNVADGKGVEPVVSKAESIEIRQTYASYVETHYGA